MKLGYLCKYLNMQLQRNFTILDQFDDIFGDNEIRVKQFRF